MGSIETHRRFEIGNNTNPVVKWEFHGFCDASLNGYGACIYLETIYKPGKISVKLLSSKSRVARLKQETIPRLELLGALLLSQLMLSVRNSLKDEFLFDNVYYWCDSQIVLAWIESTNKEFKAFIENRVNEIRKNSIIENWYYCKTVENPSDLITRKQIIDLNSSRPLWEGQIFLKEHNIFENKGVIEIDIIEEKRENTFVCLSDIKGKVDFNEVLNINKYSNFKKLVRI